MPRRILVQRLVPSTSRASQTRRQCVRAFSRHSRLSTSNPRPSLPFLSLPSSKQIPVRYFTSDRAKWLKHEAKLVVRYTIVLWGSGLCFVVMWLAWREEMHEREYPTPPEWDILSRKFFRDANLCTNPVSGKIHWAETLKFARETLLRLEASGRIPKEMIALSDQEDPALEMPREFIPYDISGLSEEWRRGYFEALFLAAKAAEHCDGWVRDTKLNLNTPPEYVIGPSNPRPRPIPPGYDRAPREEDCVEAFPVADRFYMKLLATKGFTPRQKMEAALEYASFMEYKGRPEGTDTLYKLAVAEATQGMDPSKLPFDPKTFVIKDDAGPPSLNVLDVVTTIATRRAREGDLASALPIYISILKARRRLSDQPPPTPTSRPKRVSIPRQIIDFFSPPEYPPPPPDGNQPPWRSPEERCQEAALNLYIGEILFAKTSQEEGLAWTRDGVDSAEEQLRKLFKNAASKASKKPCRECLSIGLGNWAIMVSKLADEESRKKDDSATSSKVFNFWSGPPQAEDRWAAEKLVVEERVKRTKELLEDVTPPPAGIISLFKA